MEGKHGDWLVFARTEEEDLAAHLLLFRCCDELGFYFDLDGDQAEWYEKAKQGDGQAAKWLLGCREDYEYERLYVEWVDAPTDKLEDGQAT